MIPPSGKMAIDNPSLISLTPKIISLMASLSLSLLMFIQPKLRIQPLKIGYLNKLDFAAKAIGFLSADTIIKGSILLL